MSDNNSKTPVHFREKIRRIIFDHNTPASKGFDIVLLVLIFLAVFATMLESMESVRDEHGDALHHDDGDAQPESGGDLLRHRDESAHTQEEREGNILDKDRLDKEVQVGFQHPP